MKFTFKVFAAFIFSVFTLTITCSFSTYAQIPEIENGIYLISTAEELKWFSDNIEDNSDTDAKLTADIDLSSLCSEASANWTPIGSYSYPYSGTFDGNGYSISGLYINDHSTDSYYCGLFGYLKGTIKNISVEGTVISEFGGAGGIAGFNTGNIENSIFSGYINGAMCAGGIAAENSKNGLIQSCCTVIINGETAETPITYNNGGRNPKNCYYNEENGDDNTSGTTAVALSSIYSGEVCYLLNNSQENIIWHQNIDNGKNTILPCPSARYGTVYKTNICATEEIYYSNFNMIHHKFTDGICESCCTKRISTNSANLILNESIDMKYHITVNDPVLLNSSIIMNYSFEDNNLNMSVPCNKESDVTYTAVIPCQVTQMGQTIYTEAYAEDAGEIICTENDITEYSILKYSEQILNDQTGAYSDSCKKLILNILKYGYESQEYFYNDSSFKEEVTNNFSEYFERFAVSDPDVQNPDMSMYNESVSDPAATISSAYLTLNSKVCLNIKVKSSVSGISLKFEDTKTGETRIIPMYGENEIYLAKIQDISAENLLNDFKLTVLDENENIISNTIGYNIEKYIYTVINSSDNQINKAYNICLALLGYGEAVSDYCSGI